MTDTHSVLECLQDCFDPITDDDVRLLEADLQVTFPDAFRQFLRTFNAAHAVHAVAIRVRERTKWVDEVPLANTLGIVRDARFSEMDVRWNMECFEDRMPDGLVPIAAGHYLLVCLGAAQQNYGRVFAWLWGDGEGDCVHLLADDFSEFLTRLYRQPEEEDYLEELPIFRMVEQGRLAAVQEYLADNGKPDCRNGRGHTLLACAARCRWPSIVRLLLDRGANPNSVDADGNSPIYQAILNHSLDCTKLLLSAGANPKWRNDDGQTLHYIAWENAAFRIAYEIEKHNPGHGE